MPRAKPGGSLRRSSRASTEPVLADADRALLDRLTEGVCALPQVRALLLFGSLARGEARPDSDIDLLIVTDAADPGRIRRRVAQIIGALRPHRDVRPILTNLQDLDPTFLRTVLREGRLLHGKLVVAPGKLGAFPHALFSYDLRPTSASTRVRLSQKIHGYRSRKRVRGKMKSYAYPGWKDREGATLVARSVLLVRGEDAALLERELRGFGVRFERRDVYL